MKLREYQNDLLNHVRRSIGEGKRKIIIQAPTGAGKSILMADIAKRAVEKGNNALFLVDRRDLVFQIIEKFTEYGIGDRCGMILSGEETDFSANIMAATIQTFHRRLRLDDPESNIWFHRAEVVFVDECHHSVCKSYLSVLDLYKEKSIIIGATATPCRADGMGLGLVYDEIVSSANVKELTDQGYLVPVIYYAPSTPDLSGVGILAGDYNKKQLGGAMNKPKLVGDVFTQWSKIAPNRQTIIFAVNTKHSRAIQEEFSKNGIATEHIDAHTPKEERQDIYWKFKSGDIQIITNVGITTEGTDLPVVSCIVLARPTKSFGLYFQMAGRGLRPYPGKEDCIIIDHSGVVHAHGFIDDPVEWTLDDTEKAWHKKKKRIKEKKLMTCKNCMFVFEGRICPRCGAEVKNYSKMIETTDDDLVRVKGKEKKQKYTKEDRQRFYSMALAWRKEKGYKRGWSAWTYKSKFGVWPRGLDENTIVPDEKFKRFITHLNIKRAKAQKKTQDF